MGLNEVGQINGQRVNIGFWLLHIKKQVAGTQNRKKAIGKGQFVPKTKAAALASKISRRLEGRCYHPQALSFKVLTHAQGHLISSGAIGAAKQVQRICD